MTRVNAALLAGVTTVLLFLATIGAVDWFMRAGGLFKLARLGHFLPILIASNSWMFVWLPIVLTQRRKKQWSKTRRLRRCLLRSAARAHFDHLPHQPASDIRQLALRVGSYGFGDHLSQLLDMALAV